MLLLLTFLLISAAVALGAMAFAKPKGKTKVEKRLKRSRDTGNRTPAAAEPVSRKGDSKYLTILEARLRPLAERRLTPKQQEALTRMLQSAGDYQTTPAQLLARKFLWAAMLPLLFLLSNWVIFEFGLVVAGGLTVALAIVGYILPDQRLKGQTEQRQNAIIRSMPTTLDLLTTCVEAGLSLQASMAKVVELGRAHPLREEMERTLKEIQLGRPRSEALREFGKRSGLKELNSVAISMVQAEAMGTSIAKTLRLQSEMLREARWQRAQEMANKATLKLTFPTVFLIFPTIFVIIFGPMILGFLIGR